jgi:hypothetical protein
MLIEYKIKFEKDGLTVSQRIEPNSTAPQVTKSPVAIGPVKALNVPAGAGSENPLAELSSGPNPAMDDTSGPNPSMDDTSGPTAVAQSPIFVLGPIVFNNPAQSSAAQPKPPNNQGPEASKGKAAAS